MGLRRFIASTIARLPGWRSSVFGPNAEATAVANRLDVGSVIVNDLIVPTADPRLPFGGRGASGHGVTRGPEGLLAMTHPRTVSVRRGRWLPHLDPVRSGDASLLTAILQMTHRRPGDKALPRLRRLATGRGPAGPDKLAAPVLPLSTNDRFS